jgi:hypothetical protein
MLVAYITIIPQTIYHRKTVYDDLARHTLTTPKPTKSSEKIVAANKV